MSSSNRNSLLAIVACLLWSSAFVTGKTALLYMTPLSIAGLRFLLAGVMQTPVTGQRGAALALVRQQPVLVFQVSFYNTILLYASFFYALTLVRGAQAAILIGSSPLTAALVAHMMTSDDKLNRRSVWSILLGMSGIVVLALSTKPWEPVGFREFLGMLLLLVGSVGSAVGNVVVSRKRGSVHPVALNCSQMLVGGAVLFVAALVVEGIPDFRQPTLFYLCLVWLAVISASGFGIWFFLLARVKVSKLNVWKFLIPVFGAGLSWALLPGESPDLPSIVGMILVVAGLLVSTRAETQDSRG